MQSKSSRATITDLSGNSVSRVWREGNVVYKTQPKFLTDNEIWCLKQMYDSGYVPRAWQVDIETIAMLYIEPQPVMDRESFKSHQVGIMDALREAGIRHGDITIYSIIPHLDRPYLIDFAESRLECDPRPDKRPESSDRVMLHKTLLHYANGGSTPHT